nr:D-galactarate dehydratase [Klebsiella pneumoniae]
MVEKRWGRLPNQGKAPSLRCSLRAASDQTRPHLRRNPASDFVCGTQQVASGITVQVFTTGRGTPYGLMAVPVIKWRPVPSWPTAGMT